MSEPTEAHGSTEPTSIEEWSSKTRPQSQEVPSGNVAVLKRKPLPAFLKTGKIPNSLIPIVNRLLVSGRMEDAKISEWNEEQMRDLLVLFDNVTVECVVAPVVSPIPTCLTCEGSGKQGVERGPKGRKTTTMVECSACKGKGEMGRQAGKLYVDDVDIRDKAFIYQYAIGAVDDLESFRKREEGTVVPIRPRKVVGSATKRPSRAKR